ncbi:APOF protein, partial [Rhinopomastus cyanomelas]|nr:APOF protein [Rhinopomastus cyanomelas]
MPRALLFLVLLRLGSSSLMAISLQRADDDRGDRAAVQELLAELAERVPPQALTGLSCQELRPSALPGFSRLPPQPRSLARAALALALSGAACTPQARDEVLALNHELGPVAAAALLRGLAGLPGNPAPQALTLLLLSLVQPCRVPHDPPAAVGPSPEGRQALPLPRLCSRALRQRRQDEPACKPPGESDAHSVLQWVPGVSTFYNLGTSIYFASQGCQALASQRALEAAEDLGYAGLSAITAGLGGPVALGVQLGLQPGIKAGVRALYNYFTSAGDPPAVPTAHSGPVRIV